ncbi:MAG: hypothetical protein CG438_494 [Methylococcaceae bacterium NSP1-1]|nr:MAG: hypothetical protein CG438_494 [Methylococcaceae bacterium NSP1-1]
MNKRWIGLAFLIAQTAMATPDCAVKSLQNDGKTAASKTVATKLQESNPCTLLNGMKAKHISSVWHQLWRNKKDRS